MGALIVVLIVVVEQARVHAESIDSGLETQNGELGRQRESYLQQIRLLEQSYQEKFERLAARRQQLSSLQGIANELTSRLTELDQNTKNLQQQLGLATRRASQSEQELAGIRQQIDDENQQLKKNQSQSDGREVSYALIPYSGPNDTKRRPLYIECFSDRVVLQPEGIVFHDEDFRGPIGPNNPLAAALRAAREYMARGTSHSHQEQPYPLLIVRPDAAEAYAAARAAMKSWDEEFGYELIPEDMKLAYAPADPELAQILRDAVQTAREHQRRVELALGVSSQQSFESNVWAPSRRGGFVRVPSEGESEGSAFGRGSSSEPALEGGDQPGRPGTGKQAVVSAGPYGGALHPPGGAEAPAAEFDRRNAGDSLQNRPGASHVPEGPGPALHRSGSFDSGGSASHVGSAPVSSPSGAAPGQPNMPSGSVDPQPGGSGSPPGTSSAGPGRGPGQGTGSRATSGGSAATPQGPDIFPQGASSSLAESRGADWALPNSSEGSLGITRPIAVACQRNRIVIRPESGSTANGEVIAISGSTHSAIDPLVSAIWKRMESWGIAGPGVYWKPELHVMVAPEAEFRFRELEALMKESGIPVVRKTGPRGRAASR
jgi:hypothetical protein